ncbi:MAG: hypothetical protein V4596_09790 [Bdellovibrionota bacterium]
MNGRIFALENLKRIRAIQLKLFFHDGLKDPLYITKDYDLLKKGLKKSHFCLLEEKKLFMRRLNII